VLAVGVLAVTTFPAVAAARPGPSRTATIDPFVQHELAATPKAVVTVMVHAASANAASRAAHKAGLIVEDGFDLVDVVVAKGTTTQVRKLENDHTVTDIEGDKKLKLLDSTTTTQTTSDQYVLDNPTRFHDANGDPINGSGVTVAVVDTGVDPTHPMLDGRVVVNQRFIGDNAQEDLPSPLNTFNDAQWVSMGQLDSDSTVLGGHGTAVSAVAVGNLVSYAGEPLHGEAPGAKLAMLAIGAGLSEYASDAGLYWVLEHYANPCRTTAGVYYHDAACPPIRVVNNSYAVEDPVGSDDYDPTATTNLIQNQLVADGVVVVWGNGDDGGTGATSESNSFGIDPTRGVMTVGFTDEPGVAEKDAPVDVDSSTGQIGRIDTYPDLVAPGLNVVTACLPTMLVCDSAPETDNLTNDENAMVNPKTTLLYRALTGSSLSAPMVAGIAAMMVQADPAITPARVEQLLEDTAYRFENGTGYEPDLPWRNPDTPTSFDKGHGLVDAAAIGAELNQTVPPRPTCAPGIPVIRDPEGNADDVETFSTPLPDIPSLDILDGDVAWDAATQSLVVDLHMAALSDANPTASTGASYDLSFDAGSTSYGVAASVLKGAATYSFTAAGKPTGNITGAYDLGTSTITWTIVNSGLSPRTVLSDFGAEAARQIEFEADGVNYASSPCFDLLGTGPFPRAPIAATPEVVDATITPATPWSAQAPLGDSLDDPFASDECALPTDACTTYRVTAAPTTGDDTLTFDLATGNPSSDTVDLWIIDPNGDQFHGGPSASPAVVIPDAYPGTYSVTVDERETQSGADYYVAGGLS